MKSIASPMGISIHQRVGLSDESTRTAGRTIPFDEALPRYDKNGDRQIAKSEVTGTEKMDRWLSDAFEAFDMNRDDKLDTKIGTCSAR